jgi:hypothetical protein
MFSSWKNPKRETLLPRGPAPDREPWGELGCGRFVPDRQAAGPCYGRRARGEALLGMSTTKRHLRLC